MPFLPHHTTVTIFPHLFSKINKREKDKYRNKYVKIKRIGTAAVLSTVGVTEGTQLAKDVICSKLKAHAYKSFFAILIGPTIQFITLPFYVFSYGSRLRRIAIATTEIGGKITKGEFGVVNWAWITIDLALFGEPVSITEDSDFMILNNETAGYISEIIEDVAGQ